MQYNIAEILKQFEEQEILLSDEGLEQILEFIKKYSSSVTLDKPLINVLIDSYSSDYVKNITDTKYGNGASDYIIKAFRYYSENNTPLEK